MPLSLNENSQNGSSLVQVMTIRGGLPPLNFSALLSRFWNTAVSSGSSASTSGRCPVSTVAPVSSIVVARLFLAWASAASLDTSAGSRADRPTRLYWSRSLISACIRLAPSTANSMYWSARASSWPA